MTDYAAVLRELMLAGYEGSSLLAAFDRLCAAIGSNVQNMQTAVGVVASAPKRANVRQAKVAPSVILSRAPRAYPAPDGAKAIGRKALAASGLSSSAIRVGSQLLEHFNIKTGRCDPGITGLAAKAGISSRSAQRAIVDLVSAGLFTVARNAGQGHKNAYYPTWPRLVEMADSVVAGVTVLSSGDDKSVTQNHRTKPDSDSVPVKAPRGRQPDRVPGQRELTLLRTMQGGRPVTGPAQSDAAVAATRQRLFQQMHAYLSAQLMPDKAAFASAMAMAGEADIERVVEAEMNRKGSGLDVWLGSVRQMRATG